jgi:hypothetical protein
MTAGLPGAGIGGLFYLASTLLLPVRSLVRRARRGNAHPVDWRRQSHSVLMAVGIIAALWLAGWLLAFILPVEMRPAGSPGSGAVATAGTVLPVAAFGIGIATLVMVLLAVEVARLILAPRSERPSRRLTRGAP